MVHISSDNLEVWPPACIVKPVVDQCLLGVPTRGPKVLGSSLGVPALPRIGIIIIIIPKYRIIILIWTNRKKHIRMCLKFRVHLKAVRSHSESQ